MVTAELAMARRSGSFNSSCWAGTHRIPPPMPSKPAVSPMGTPTQMIFQGGKGGGFFSYSSVNLVLEKNRMRL
ncbi:MAG: hypothetical protein BWY71_01220 [Planctomycetes bacterium ADurb.Bin412]|nr:MAG: hypothetical protein BWY71_01220 [Planctomycetes bacterium ADurb.Bin412]